MVAAQRPAAGRRSVNRNATRKKALDDADAVISFLMGILLSETKA